MDNMNNSFNSLEIKLMELLKESRQALESADKITFGNSHVNNMKTNCHNMNRKIAEARGLLGHIKQTT